MVKGKDVKGVVIGKENRLILDKVLQKERLKAGDLLVTSGEKGIFPPHLLVGRIKTIEKDQRQVFQKVEVEPLINYNNLKTVFLIIQ